MLPSKALAAAGRRRWPCQVAAAPRCWLGSGRPLGSSPRPPLKRVTLGGTMAVPSRVDAPRAITTNAYGIECRNRLFVNEGLTPAHLNRSDKGRNR
jgi:hypothetical protein